MAFSENAKDARAAQRKAEKKYDEKRKDWRARAWQCIVYEESAANSWLERLHKQGVTYFISPLHDRDLKENGELKKPHWHVVFDAGSSRLFSGDQAKEMFDIIGGVYPDPVKDRKKFLEVCKVKRLERALRYLCHLDDPAKAAYSVEDVIYGYSEISYTQMIMTQMEKDGRAIEMCRYALENNVTDFATYVMLCIEDKPEWVHALIHDASGRFVAKFINGLLTRNREEREKKKYLMSKWRYENESGKVIREDELEREVKILEEN